MKHIRKQQEPVEFIQWKDLNKDLNVTFDDLHTDVKNRVKQGLMVEQGYICCYCERRLEERDSHIEHLRPQDPYADEALLYENMLCSCLMNTKRGEPLHCGALRKKWYDNHYISPVDPDCETRFRYTNAGEILPKPGDEGAQVTIKNLGLNIDKLIALRYSALIPFQDENLSPEELGLLVADYLQPDSEGKFKPFYTTIRYLFQGA